MSNKTKSNKTSRTGLEEETVREEVEIVQPKKVLQSSLRNEASTGRVKRFVKRLGK